ncbi:carboxypeptidase-like regulatory domain-containing protein, partial [Flavobacteriaceae bacterium]|nr:carboxypeptidase-like regulatory domain-containing protein [Flavobacteriaceae bacterium]
RAVDLADTLKEKGYEQIETKLTSILEKTVKENSYFKFKSGLFSTKVDRDEIIDQVLDSLPADSTGLAKKALEEEKLKGSFHKYRQKKMGNLFEGLIKKNKLNFNVLNKASLYTFEIMNFTFIENTAVYQIKFEPKNKKGKFKGTLFVDADNYTLIQLDYENVKPLKDFSLMGFSFQLYRQKMLLKFAKFNGENYQLQFYEREINYKFGVDRPLKILEKNKYVKGRRKQNELSADLHLKQDQSDKLTLIIFENSPLTTKEFQQLKPQKGFKQDKLNGYDPNYWKDFTIVEPNEVIRSFKTVEE